VGRTLTGALLPLVTVAKPFEKSKGWMATVRLSQVCQVLALLPGIMANPHD
jgi:hypothetical protein